MEITGFCERRDTLERFRFLDRGAQVDVIHDDGSIATLEAWRFDRFFAQITLAELMQGQPDLPQSPRGEL